MPKYILESGEDEISDGKTYMALGARLGKRPPSRSRRRLVSYPIGAETQRRLCSAAVVTWFEEPIAPFGVEAVTLPDVG